MTQENVKKTTKIDFTGILNYAIYIILLAFIVFVAFYNENFMTISNWLTILQQCSPYFIASTGMALVLTSGSIDISVGQNILLSSACGVMLSLYLIKNGIMQPDTLSLFLVCTAVSLVTGAIVGFINGVCIAKFEIIPFIATLAMTNIARGVSLCITGGESKPMEGLTRTVNTRIGPYFPAVLIPAIIVLVVFDFVARQLPFGRKMRAIGWSAGNAQKVGINVVRSKIIVHTICGAMVGVCGIILASQTAYHSMSLGTGSEFIIISGCTLGGVSLFGGKGSIIPGAVIGVLMVQLIFNGLTMVNASPHIYSIARGVIIFLAVMIESIRSTRDLK
ncbi:MAG: ABC transporter permease [Oscillospiraceae bacterium]|nr:ABC transporter permease [Oscillospiraceae bacterium]